MRNTLKEDERFFILEDVHAKSRYKVPTKDIVRCFWPSYCNTVHSSQGSAIDEKFLIVDWKSKRVDKYWLYTAVSRLTMFDHVFFLGISLKDENLEDKRSKEAIHYMIKGYQQQDRRAGRSWGEGEYIESEDIRKALEAQGGRCQLCGECITVVRDTVHLEATVDRLHSAPAHTKQNFHCMLCVDCNKAKSNSLVV